MFRLLFKKTKEKPVEEKGLVMVSELKKKKKEMNEYYLNKIIELMEGSHKMGMGVINLENIKGWYGYYGIDDTIIYWDSDIKDALLKEGIASLTNSASHLIITTADYRVKQLRDGSKN